MSAITVIVVPTWAVWLLAGFAVVNIAQHLWKIKLLRRQIQAQTPATTGDEGPNVRANPDKEAR